MHPGASWAASSGVQSAWHAWSPLCGSYTPHSIMISLPFPVALWPPGRQAAPTPTHSVPSAPTPGKDLANWFHLTTYPSVMLLSPVWELLGRVKGYEPLCTGHSTTSRVLYNLLPWKLSAKYMFGLNKRWPNNDTMYCFIEPLKQSYKEVILLL